jgi:hypothetical protein
MALVPGKPIKTTGETSSAFFTSLDAVSAMSPAEIAPVMRFTKQVSGGANRNGTLCVDSSTLQWHVSKTTELFRNRPRTAIARQIQHEVAAARRPVLNPNFSNRIRPRNERRPPLPAEARCVPKKTWYHAAPCDPPSVAAQRHALPYGGHGTARRHAGDTSRVYGGDGPPLSGLSDSVRLARRQRPQSAPVHGRRPARLSGQESRAGAASPDWYHGGTREHKELPTGGRLVRPVSAASSRLSRPSSATSSRSGQSVGSSVRCAQKTTLCSTYLLSLSD